MRVFAITVHPMYQKTESLLLDSAWLQLQEELRQLNFDIGNYRYKSHSLQYYTEP